MADTLEQKTEEPRAVESLIVVRVERPKSGKGKTAYVRRDTHSFVDEKDIRLVMAAPLTIPCGLVDGKDGRIYSGTIEAQEREVVPGEANAVLLWKYIRDDDGIAQGYAASYARLKE